MEILVADSIEVTLNKKPILRGAYLSVAEGERVGLLGLNGSG